MDANRPAAITLPSDGLFPSHVTGHGMDMGDLNGFTTAQVLRALGAAGRRILGATVHEAALHALLSCRNPATGGFRFWPLDKHPQWAPDLPDDADDTAIMALVLFSANRISMPDLRKMACHTVVCHRTRVTVQPGPSWQRVGVFKTWMKSGFDPDMTDCTVNANVVALLAMANLRNVPGYAESCSMILEAISWANDDEQRAACLSPFYPEPGELALAVEAAAACGALELRPALQAMHAAPMWRRLRERTCTEVPTICGSPYGLIRWESPVVGWARRIGGLAAGCPPALLSSLNDFHRHSHGI